jgi:hypothetical protein
MRKRLSESPVGEKLTYSSDISLAECENFILESAVEENYFRQWLAHLVHFRLQILREPDPYSVGDDPDEYENLKSLITKSLYNAGYESQSLEVSMAKDENDLNKTIVSQYTDISSLYSEVNLLLRDGHEGRDIGKENLTPWILQLNAAIRRQDEYGKPSYRGANFSKDDLEKYNVGDMFIWSPFTSASKSKDNCLDGNVLFEFKPVSALSEYGKRAPRDVSSMSYFPEEEEVLFPICCAFRITSKEKYEGDRILIKMDVLDHH